MLIVNGVKINFGHFPNGEINIPNLNVYERARNTVILKYEDDSDLFRLLLVYKALKNRSVLHITYFPYSRMDRESKDYVFTLKTVAEFINSMDWRRVIVYEPHSDVTPALLNNVEIVSPIPALLSKLWAKTTEDFQTFYPDAGAQKRYGEANENTLVGFKRRDFKTGRITDLQILGGKLADTVVIVDDLCSKGGTFVLAAEKLREMGFQKIFLVVAHCEKTIFEGKVFSSGLIDAVYTTDSILDGNQGQWNLYISPLIQ